VCITFPRHNDFIENGQRKGLFLGYDEFNADVSNSHSNLNENGD
jgi:hypothetical protein